LEEYKLAGSEWVHGLPIRKKTPRINKAMIQTYGKCKCGHKSTEKATPHRLDTECMAHFLNMGYRMYWSIRSVTKMPERRTSIENKTPPIGEPKATATPAALAAVIISRILPVQVFHLPMPSSDQNSL